MFKSKTTVRLCLSVLAITCAMAAMPAAAQTASNLICNGCVNSTDIRDRGIRAQDLASGVVFGETVFVRSNAGSATAAHNAAIANDDLVSTTSAIMAPDSRSSRHHASQPDSPAPQRLIGLSGRWV